MNVPLIAIVPAGASQLVMEVFTPDGGAAGKSRNRTTGENSPNGAASGNLLFIGSNADPETGPSYLSAANCGIPTPTTTAGIGFPNMHIVVNVNGSCDSGPTPTPTPTPTDTPTPTTAPTATPTPTQTPAPFITVEPTAIQFTGVAGGAFPAPQSIQVTPSNGASWTSFDTSPWFDAAPTSGASGTSTTLTPHTEGLAAGDYSQDITFSAAGCPDKVVVVTLTLTASPTPTPTETPTPILRARTRATCPG